LVPPVDDAEAAAVETVEEVEKDSVTVRIDENNVYWIAVAADKEQRAVSSQEMRAKVRQARDGAGGNAPVSKMLVQAHGDAVHEKLVDVLDAGSATQMQEIRLMVYEDGDLY
jgi:biopolymer transport protein ExbD